jgi:phosphatidate phosphatase APP1
MLQDYGIDDRKLVHLSHREHKLTQIDEILSTYLELPFVLVGDSGQLDPEIYRVVASKHGDRIRAIYIRDVTAAPRDGQVAAIAAELDAAGLPTAIITAWAEAGAHAHKVGLISRITAPNKTLTAACRT